MPFLIKCRLSSITSAKAWKFWALFSCVITSSLGGKKPGGPTLFDKLCGKFESNSAVGSKCCTVNGDEVWTSTAVIANGSVDSVTAKRKK